MQYVYIDESGETAVKQLQMVDFAAWAIGRYYEIGDDTFYDMIKEIANE